jgi:hypothetical protein
MPRDNLLISRFYAFEMAVNAYNINPTLSQTKDKVRAAYANYVCMKKEFPTPTELLDKEEKLMKDLGELLE